MSYTRLWKCRVCHGGLSQLVDWCDLDAQPLANGLLASADEQPAVYPLVVCQCHACGHVQLRYSVTPGEMFNTSYPYRPSSTAFFAHCLEFAQWALAAARRPGQILDIGGCDGTLLQAFSKLGIPNTELFSIDPSTPRPAFAYNHTQGFFPQDFPYRDRRFLTICAQNVLGHVEEPRLFMRGVTEILAPDGLLILEVPYLVNLIDGNQFDTIYHEHVSYWLISTLSRLVAESMGGGYEILSVVHRPVHGGTIRVAIGRRQLFPAAPLASDFREPWWEIRSEFDGHRHISSWGTPYTRFNDHLRTHKQNFWELYHRNSLGKNQIAPGTMGKNRWAGFGAAAKSTVVSSFFGLGPEQIRYIVDDTPEKQGKYTPHGIPIVSPERLREDPVNTILVFPWNWLSAIGQRLRDLGQMGKRVVTVVPDVRCEVLG